MCQMGTILKTGLLLSLLNNFVVMFSFSLEIGLAGIYVLLLILDPAKRLDTFLPFLPGKHPHVCNCVCFIHDFHAH